MGKKGDYRTRTIWRCPVTHEEYGGSDDFHLMMWREPTTCTCCEKPQAMQELEQRLRTYKVPAIIKPPGWRAWLKRKVIVTTKRQEDVVWERPVRAEKAAVRKARKP